MLCQIFFQLDVELDKAIHGERDAKTFNYHDPNVGEGGIQGFEAVATNSLGDDSNDGHEDTDKAVLEDSKVD